MTTNALLLSSSRAGNTPYLKHALSLIKSMTKNAKKWVFIPYAGVSFSYDKYLDIVATALTELNIEISSIHQHDDPKKALEEAEGIMVGGGNTFHLLHELYRYNLIDLIKNKVSSGIPYVGWSAGSNITGLSIRTTNDMPIIEPPSFAALNILPFQVNPHYTNYQAPGHNGETRAQRLLEFTKVDPRTPVVGIVEGTALLRQGDKLTLIGDEDGYLFCGEQQEVVIPAGSDLSHLLN
ncbi:dipeptidase PepE [Parashewanella spongiae]|uniref:Peptidase E n=1 Tax=Parashewanella spongiae TaxID=342950 RepID=A0A3A6TTB7_9GAMM|nr:dipeptidase PepE [Parashewanella spongiae]MCL1076720.1 dipeptidase PepE [Parashewanella spongiae]RJY19464.1 dipeptidase PepE [Parashewanella spongiae]